MAASIVACFLYFQKKKEEGVIETSDKDIVAEAERLDVKAMGPLVLTEVLFDEKIREQIKKYRRHFLRVSSTSDLSYAYNMVKRQHLELKIRVTYNQAASCILFQLIYLQCFSCICLHCSGKLTPKS